MVSNVFGLTNVLGTFTRLMNHVLRFFIEKFIVVYLDDILIYSKRLDEHINNSRQVLETIKLAIDIIQSFNMHTSSKKYISLN